VSTKITPAAVEAAVKVGVRIHQPDCDTGIQGFISMGNVKVKLSIDIPGLSPFDLTWEPPA